MILIILTNLQKQMDNFIALILVPRGRYLMESSITLQFTRSKTLLEMRNLDTMKTLAWFLLMLLLTPFESMPEIFQFPTLQYQLYIGKLVTVFQLLTTQKDRMFFVSAPHMKFYCSIGLSWYQSTSSYRCHDMSYHLKEIPWPLKSESLIEIIFFCRSSFHLYMG